jgi:hypothetical protein
LNGEVHYPIENGHLHVDTVEAHWGKVLIFKSI